MTDSRAPYFSILLPTKNRSQLVGNAIKSLLHQSFVDFELIISDNDDDPYATSIVVNKFKDPRIKYYRTSGNLSMPDNWNNALSKASGRYITVIQDKQIYYKNALESLHKILDFDHAVEVLTFKSDVSVWDNNEEYVYRQYSSAGVWSEHSNTVLEDLVVHGPFAVWGRLPRMINSCVSKNLIKRVLKIDTVPDFFVDVTPDLSASFIQLAVADVIHHIDDSLVVTTALDLSGGLAVRKRTKSGMNFLSDIQKQDEICTYVLIKNKHVVSNLVVNDYLNVKCMIGGKLNSYSYSDENYLRIYLSDVARNIAEGNFFFDTVQDANNIIKNYPLALQLRLLTFFFALVAKSSLVLLKGIFFRKYQLLRLKFGKSSSLVPVRKIMENYKQP